MLELKNISLNVGKDSKDILNDVSFDFDSRKLYVITGPNGGGKSSLAKIIMGIYEPTQGQILFEGEDITNHDITQRAKLGIGYAFQQPPRFKGIKVRDLLKMASGETADYKHMCALLQDVGLCSQDYIDREVDDSLSGGELKRIEIATIMARDLKVAVFDEPEAGIDLWSFQKLAETFKNIHEKHDTTIVIISHQERILNLADEVIVMADGKVKEVTSKENFFADLEREELDCMCGLDCSKGVDKNVELIG
ncbi:ABC transporter ATP-binding protein [Alkalibacter mobilis]|uniref:ABC transporter ATP-binding protein n=1 Tax=Alkalibacter mobilis TaxID=2787712 RepID=UPI0018A0616B|nr:ATP-binding cassette domain-containing protein [Alkalibacter mobilis]MBF7097384.1 ATP-binding cassette domain-containing protein [Alkalibacter mobilis]